ncbi:MAG TPA: 50S ribosomal protein L9 [Acidimicrobiia bacterium]|nr:50S ribosomal protein L9 [Acidimicrobiia bacterium]
MKVVLRDDVDSLGVKGDLVDVANGYARNYLVPRGLAIRATKGIVQQASAMRRNRDARGQRERNAAQELANRLTTARIEVGARAGEAGKLFGSVTTADIADALTAQTGVTIDRRMLVLDEPIKELGPHEVPAKLHTDVTVTVMVEVVADGKSHR